MRCQLSVFLLFLGQAMHAQSGADSALVARILAAEDRREPAAQAYADGLASADARVPAIAGRAEARGADPKFSARDSLATGAPAPHYPDPAWRIRYRALGGNPVDCTRLE